MFGCRLSDFPMEQHILLRPDEGSLLPDPTQYRHLVGRLLYLTVTRPDILYIVNTPSQFMQNLCSSHLQGRSWAGPGPVRTVRPHRARPRQGPNFIFLM